MILYSWGINHSKLKVTTGRLVQCWLESPLCSLLVAGPRLISHLLAPISQSVTLPATWNLQLHLGLLKKARQPKWRRCSQWRLTCPVACCKIRRWKGGVGWGGDIMLLSSLSNTANMLLSPPTLLESLWHHHLAPQEQPCDKSKYLSKLTFHYLSDSLVTYFEPPLCPYNSS